MTPSVGAVTLLRPRLLRVALLRRGRWRAGAGRVALGEGVVGAVPGDEALGDELLLALGEALGLGHQGFQAGDLGGVGLALGVEVGGVHWPAAGPSSPGRRSCAYRGDAPGHLGTDLRVDQGFEAAEAVFGDVEGDARRGGGGDQRGGRPGRLAGGRLGLAAAGAEPDGEDRVTQGARRMIGPSGGVRRVGRALRKRAFALQEVLEGLALADHVHGGSPSTSTSAARPRVL